MPRLDPQPGLASAVRELRTAKGLSQEELANRAGVHLTWVGRLESGAANPSWGTTKRVARGLGVPHALLAALGEAKDGELAR
ncbi:MAG TPA: helix-turn-helix transcriptional regulator [Solirubrobacterales bacterium]|jgi:transcriptional regulator with XRE-family HTH domain|nr:helix-turn-helix transcriptional regulator [Solirubrobacterales bacterium]